MKPTKSRDSISDIWGERKPYKGEWPVRIDENVTEEPERWVQSACVLCSNGCGVDIGVKDGKIVGVRGRAGFCGRRLIPTRRLIFSVQTPSCWMVNRH